MNPIFNTLMAVLEEANLLTHEGAEQMALKMQGSIHQSRYTDAIDMVQEVSKEVSRFVAEPWLDRISVLETRLADLEKQLTKQK